MTITFTVPIEPMGAPRMTRADSWKKRPVVLRYRAYKDVIRHHCRGVTELPVTVKIDAYFPMPKSWSRKQRAQMDGRLHRVKPDWDNVGKGVCDAIWENDSVIHGGCVFKWYTLGQPRLVIEVSE